MIAGNQKVRITGLRTLGAAQIEAAAKADLAPIGPALPALIETGVVSSTPCRPGPIATCGTSAFGSTVRDPARINRDGSRLGIGGDVSYR